MPRSSCIRTRAYRQRLARGGRVVALEVAAQDVAALVDVGLLVASADGHAPEEVAAAIAHLLGTLRQCVPTPVRPLVPPLPPPSPWPSVVVAAVSGLGGQRRRG